MKKISLALASFLVTVVGCQPTLVDDSPIQESVAYSAVIEAFVPSTKTLMTSDKKVVWAENDQVSIFQGNIMPDQFGVTPESVGNSQGLFQLIEDNPEDAYGVMSANVAYYPYDSDLMIVEKKDDETGGGISYIFYNVDMPVTQQYTPDSFASGAFPMVAVTEGLQDNNFAFKNILGVMKLQLKGSKTIKSIKIEGKNSELLSGVVSSVVASNSDVPVITFHEDAKNYVILDCGDGVTLNPNTVTDFYIGLPPVEFAYGFSVSVADTEGSVYKIEATKSNEVLRSTILVMPEINIDDLSLDIDLRFTSEMHEVNLDISLKGAGVTGFYGIFSQKQKWDQYRSYFESGDLDFDAILDGTFAEEFPCHLYNVKAFTGKLSQFGYSDDQLLNGSSNEITPSSSYYVMILPVVSGNDEYYIEDMILYEVNSSSLTTGGDLKLPEYTITSDYRNCRVDFAPANGIYLAKYEVYYASGVALPTADNYLEKITHDAHYDSSKGFSIEVGDSDDAPGTEYKLCVLLADAQGMTSYYVIDVRKKPIPYNYALSVSVGTPTYSASDNKVYAEVTVPSGASRLYYYVTTQQSFNATIRTDLFIKIIEGTSTFDQVDLNGQAGKIEISKDVTKFNESKATKVYVHLVAADADGNISQMVTSAVCQIPKKSN